jgi:GWxTD domain-containing protein
MRCTTVVLLAAGLALAGCSARMPLPRDVLLEHPVESGQPIFFVDYAGFATDSPDSTRLEIYYQIYNFGLQFKKDTNQYIAEYTFTIVVTDGDGNRIKLLEQNKKVSVPTYDKTVSRFDFRSSQFNLNLPPGKYELDCLLKDNGGTGSRRQDLDVELRKYDRKRPLLSDVEFTQAAQDGHDSSVFSKSKMIVIPSVSRLYGGDDSTKLLYYMEVYPGPDKEERLYVETIIRSAAKGMVYRDTLYVDLLFGPVRQMRNIAIDEFAPGDYELEIYLRGRRAKQLDSRVMEFSIQWSQGRILRHDFKTAIEQLGLIATSSEIGSMKKLKTLDERVAAFNAFWESRDPTIGTHENEIKREFYRRITYANRQFRHLRQDGWRTDRGRVYVRFGEPDQIDDVPMSSDTPPYQVWHYYQHGSYRRFAFVDTNEDGDYRLQFPYDGLNQRPDF